ncbi:BnaC03g30080D [Brassica napus]|uniref:BnaC03g30080D protein n=1 Tax=Brassica napus TaxID=3708 RepID=A0A078G7D9_BRANA|nr:BnaC03g30080D [Brassica napus]
MNHVSGGRRPHPDHV